MFLIKSVMTVKKMHKKAKESGSKVEIWKWGRNWRECCVGEKVSA